MSQLLGALMRAITVLIVICTPSLLIPGTSPETTQIVTLIGLFAGAFVFSEYASTYPGLIEFRDAPPFNRVRLISLFITLFLLSIVVSTGTEVTTLSLVINATGLVIGRALEFPFSPISFILSQLPSDITPHQRGTVEIMAGLATLVGLVSLTIFAILVRLQQWPNRHAAFNVWVNLPTFDPTTGGDIVARLVRDSRINIILGFCLPYFTPVLMKVGTQHLDMAILESPQTMVWIITLWTFMSVSLFMRGMAMARVADMIDERRRRLVARLGPDDAFDPVRSFG